MLNHDPHVTQHTDRYRNQCPGYKKLDPLDEDDFFHIAAAYGERQAWLMQKARCNLLAKDKTIEPKRRIQLRMLSMNAEAQLMLLEDN